MRVVAWRPDGQVLATVGLSDETLKLWDCSEPRRISSLQVVDDLGMSPLDLAWALPLSNAIVLAGDTGEVKVLPIIDIDDMAGIIDRMILPVTRRNFTEVDALVLGVPTVTIR